MAKLNREEVMDVAMEADKKPSLQQLAMVLGIPAVRLQTAQVAYKPIEGEPYNAKAINWKAVRDFVERRLDKTDYASVDEVFEAALKVEYVPKRGKAGSAGNKVLFGTVPVRKGNIEVGTTIYSKKSGEAFDVVYVNDTIVVYEPQHEDGEKVVSSAIGNRMFNMNFTTEAPSENAVEANEAE